MSTTEHVREAGPVSLWETFEHVYIWWQNTSEPDWPRFGLTVTPDEQTVWLDSTRGIRWPLK